MTTYSKVDFAENRWATGCEVRQAVERMVQRNVATVYIRLRAGSWARETKRKKNTCDICDTELVPEPLALPKYPGAEVGGSVRHSEDLAAYELRQEAWSFRTFGHGLRTRGIVQHIRKELDEILAKPHDLSEWIDVMILAMDGYWRHGGAPCELMAHLLRRSKTRISRDSGPRRLPRMTRLSMCEPPLSNLPRPSKPERTVMPRQKPQRDRLNGML